MTKTKEDALRALDAVCADLVIGNREIDAALWWLYADHRETDTAILVQADEIGAAAALDRLVGVSAWREQTPVPMVPRLSTSFDALRHWTHTHLPGWGRESQEPGGDCEPGAKPNVTMWKAGYDTGPIWGPTLEFAGFRAAIRALLAIETGRVARDVA